MLSVRHLLWLPIDGAQSGTTEYKPPKISDEIWKGHIFHSLVQNSRKTAKLFEKKARKTISKRFGTTAEIPISAEALHVLGLFMQVNLRQSHCAKIYELILTYGKIYGLHNRLKDPDGINCYELPCKKICDPAVYIFPIYKNGEL